MDRQPEPQPLADTYDVVVVGARCAGAGTALLLARAGLAVLVVERSGRGADTLSTHALTKPGVLQLSRWGVLDAIRGAGTPKVDTVVYHYGGQRVDVAIRPDGDVDGLYAPRRTVLDRVLVEEAAGAGATVIHRTAVADLLVDDDRRVCGVVVVEQGGRTRAIRSQVVVGADGARSLVARRIGAPVDRRASSSSATAYAYVSGLADHEYRNYFERGLAAGVIPTNGGEANVWVSVAMEHFRREARADLGRFLHDRLEVVAPDVAARVRAEADLRVRGFVGLRGFTRRVWGPGWALVGDAAYFKDPISAHGMTDALIGAELLARAVVDRFGGAEEAAALGAYAETRERLTAPMADAIDRLSRFDWQPAEAQLAHVGMNEAMRAEWQLLSSLETSPMVPVDLPAAS